MVHIPVLLKETLTMLDPKPGENFIDGTFGGGGHSQAVLEKIRPAGKLLAIDWNEMGFKNCEVLRQAQDTKTNLICFRGNFANLLEIMRDTNFPPTDGLLLDLGISSDELELSGRGFSFQKDEPLLMTYGDDQVPVKQLLRQMSETELTAVLKSFGEERYAKNIARIIKEQQRKRPIETTSDLVETIFRATPARYHHQRLHPATKTFMALRIYANNELKNLEKVLNDLEKIMAPGGRAGIISFHSLEDRAVKNHFRKLQKEEKGQVLTKKIIAPSREEMGKNPRSRSAKLRVLKINDFN